MGEQLDAVGPELGPNSCKKQPEMITGPWVQLCLHFPEREREGRATTASPCPWCCWKGISSLGQEQEEVTGNGWQVQEERVKQGAGALSLLMCRVMMFAAVCSCLQIKE